MSGILQDWRDTLSRLRCERNRYTALAAENQKAALELKKKRSFLEALKAACRASEYRQKSASLSAEINAIRKTYGIR